jgi:hypothetical protein
MMGVAQLYWEDDNEHNHLKRVMSQICCSVNDDVENVDHAI